MLIKHNEIWFNSFNFYLIHPILGVLFFLQKIQPALIFLIGIKANATPDVFP